MTTVACDGKSMAGDGLETADNTIVGYSVDKVFKLADGSILGAAGQSSDIKLFMDWLEDDDEDSKPPKVKDFAALVLDTDGQLFYYDDTLAPTQSESPAAIGTGKDHALTAMDMGADAHTAVEMAARRDVFTGGDITSLKI